MSTQSVLAATLVEPGRYELREYPLPDPAPGCVLVKMEVSGICGTCYFCRHDFPYYFCENTTDYGNNLSARNPPHLFGGWSQYLYVLPGSFLVRVPDDLPSEIAVLTEIMAVTVGLDRAKQISAFPNESFRFDDTVVVLGVGPLGMCFVMKARMLGAGTIVAVDLSDYRLDFAKR